MNTPFLPPCSSVVQFVFLCVFNAPRPKSSYGVVAELTREQQRWVWESMAQRRELLLRESMVPGVEAAVASASELGVALSAAHSPSEGASPRNEHEAAAVDESDAAVDDLHYLCLSDDTHEAMPASTAAPEDMLPPPLLADVLYDDPDAGGRQMSARLLLFLDKLGQDTPTSESFFNDPHERDDASAEVEEFNRQDKGGFTLPDPDDRAAFDAFTDMITARDCLAVVARHDELTHTYAHLKEQTQHGNDKEAHRHLETVRELLGQFERRWGFTRQSCAGGGLTALWRACTRGAESEEERLERLVRAKVQRV